MPQNLIMKNAFKETIEGPEGVSTLATGRIITTVHINGKSEEVIA
jgi:hypothetical protein